MHAHTHITHTLCKNSGTVIPSKWKSRSSSLCNSTCTKHKWNHYFFSKSNHHSVLLPKCQAPVLWMVMSQCIKIHTLLLTSRYHVNYNLVLYSESGTLRSLNCCTPWFCMNISSTIMYTMHIPYMMRLSMVCCPTPANSTISYGNTEFDLCIFYICPISQ